jgi:O-methyltransferase
VNFEKKMKSFIRDLFRAFNYQITRISDGPDTHIQEVAPTNIRTELLDAYKGNHLYSDFTDKEIEIINKVRKFTLTSPERIVSLINSVKYIVENKIPGDFVECGVWRGGSMMVIALTLIELGITDRNLYLYDTYQGMSEPSVEDISHDNITAEEQLSKVAKSKEYNIWCYSTLDEVKNNLKKTNYQEARIHYIKGKVEETIPGVLPGKIALLRLDTDWYESTYHELVHLYPLLVAQGILIIDDYGHWKGSKTATDKYFNENKQHLLLNRVDYTCRVAQKL